MNGHDCSSRDKDRRLVANQVEGDGRAKETVAVQLVMKKMEAQLRRWNVKIEQRAANSLQKSGHTAFEALLHVDELKVLYAIAQSKLEELEASAEADRERLEAETQSAFNELAAALKSAMPPP